MVRLAALLIAASLLLQEDADIARWIDDLGHEELQRREQAQRELIKVGSRAMPALKKAMESGRFSNESENRVRLENVHRLVGEAIHDAEYRKFSLGLLTFDAEKTTLGVAFKSMERARQCVFESSVDLNRKVRISGKDLPFRQVLDSIEDQLDVSIQPGEGANSRAYLAKSGRLPRPPRAYLPGLTLEVRRAIFNKEGKPAGSGLLVIVDEIGFAFLDGFQVHGVDGRERPFQPCLRCGNKILLKGDSKEEIRLTIQGELFWGSHYVFDVSDLRKDQVFRVGNYTLNYAFFKVRVVGEGSATERYGSEVSLGGRSKTRGNLGFVGAGGIGDTGDEEHLKWCDGSISRHRSAKQQLSFSDTVDLNPKGLIDPSDMESVQISFDKRIREPFRVTLTIPAE